MREPPPKLRRVQPHRRQQLGTPAPPPPCGARHAPAARRRCCPAPSCAGSARRSCPGTPSATWRRYSRSGNSRPPTVCPSKMISPAVTSISDMISRDVVDLPQPDSPTTPRVSPLRISKLTSSTACTDPVLRPRKPLEKRKMFRKARVPSAKAAPGRRRPEGDAIQGYPCCACEQVPCRATTLAGPRPACSNAPFNG